LSVQDQAIINHGNPLISVLKLKNYRSFWVAQFIAQLIAGALRFAFLWHAPNLGDVVWTVPLMAISTALPAFIVSLPAGAIADRMNHRIYCTILSAATAVLLLLTGALLLADLLNLYLAVLMSFLLGATGAAGMPVYQAMVPKLVGRELLASGVALQNLGMMASMVIGAVLGGGLIQFLGMDFSFLTWAVLMLLSTE
jgi:MFS family permease